MKLRANSIAEVIAYRDGKTVLFHLMFALGMPVKDATHLEALYMRSAAPSLSHSQLLSDRTNLNLDCSNGDLNTCQTRSIRLREVP